MLKSLYIKNIAVAKDVNIDFDDGFNVITGETGAGKSIILDSLLLVCGAKANKELIRAGEKSATVEALYTDIDVYRDSLSEIGVEADENGELFISREISSDGHGSAKINSRSVPISRLRDAAEILLSINMQDEGRSLGNAAEHILILDSYAGIEDKLADYKASYCEYMKLTQELDKIKKSLKDKTMMCDILKYQIAEIEKARLEALDEEERLEALRLKIKGIEKLSKCTALIKKALLQNETGASAVYLVERASQSLSQISDFLDVGDELISRLDSVRYELEDIAETVIQAVEDDIDDPEEKLNAVEMRLRLIGKLKKKYGSTISEIIEFKKDAEKKLSELEGGDITISEYEKKISSVLKIMSDKAEVITKLRGEAAIRLGDGVYREILYLDMPKSKFRIEVKPLRDSAGKIIYNSRGCDEVNFLFSANPGDEAKKLGKIASGGELSRVTLALKCQISKAGDSGTILFDEIDAGVSGSTSHRIGNKLKELAGDAQVICITHSPQIAALADVHFLIKKVIKDSRAESTVTRLDKEGRINEISRIIGGISITDTQRNAAREMIDGK